MQIEVFVTGISPLPMHPINHMLDVPLNHMTSVI